MAAESGKAAAISRQQVILIGVLVIILIGVLTMGQGEGTAATTDAADTVQPRHKKQPQSREPLSKPIVWPKVTLDEMLKHNPFAETNLATNATADPETMNQEPTAPAEETATTSDQDVDKQARLERQLAFMAELRNQRVSMILKSDKGRVAVIGDRKVREGEIIEGVKILSIRPDGVVIERVEDE